MKKITRYLVLLFVLLLPNTIYAYELTCNSGSYTYNDTFECYLKGDANVQYDKLSGTITTDNNLSCTRISIASGLILLEDSSNDYFNLSGTPTNDTLATFSCQVVNNVTSNTSSQLTINDFKYHIYNSGVDESHEILSTDYIRLIPTQEVEEPNTKPRDVSNQNSRIKTITEPNLGIIFSQFVTEYNIEVLYEVNELNMDIQAVNPEARIEIIGDTKLNVGKNIIDIYVTSPLGDAITCYTLYITRLARGEEIYYPEKDATLSNMTVSGYSIKFDKNIYEYNLHVTRDVDSLNINTVTTHDKATVSITSADNIQNGTIISVVVTSEDGSNTLEYKIKITKEASKKDYSSIIILGVIVGVIILIIAMFILTSQKKKKDDPLLNIKKQKRKINKGKNFDASIVPESTIPNQPIPSETTSEQSLPEQSQTLTTQPIETSQPANNIANQPIQEQQNNNELQNNDNSETTHNNQQDNNTIPPENI